MNSWHRSVAGRLVLDLHVQPGAARTAVAGRHGDCLKVRVAARAADGAANEELVRFLAEALGAAKRDVVIEAGARARRKRVAVSHARHGADALFRE